MVIKHVKGFIEKIKQKRLEKELQLEKIENFRETEEMRKAESIKKEADRLAHLKQYKAAIEEYNKSLEIYPSKEEDLKFPKVSEFFFKTNYNIAACYSYLNQLKKAIKYFDETLKFEVDNENKIKALMSKGDTYYNMKILLQGDVNGAYKIEIDSEFNVNPKELEEIKKLDERDNLLKLAHDCFAKITEIDRHFTDAWYNKGHMEFLLGNVKEAMFSFDNVLMLDKKYENKEGIELFDDIRREKGLKVDTSKIFDKEAKFKTRTGHFVRNNAEKLIADFLFDNNILFQYNTAISWADKDDFKAAFYIPKLELYLEHFKYDYIKDYEKLMKWKVKQYEKHKKKLVYTLSEDEKNIEEALKIKLKPFIML